MEIPVRRVDKFGVFVEVAVAAERAVLEVVTVPGSARKAIDIRLPAARGAVAADDAISDDSPCCVRKQADSAANHFQGGRLISGVLTNDIVDEKNRRAIDTDSLSLRRSEQSSAHDVVVYEVVSDNSYSVGGVHDSDAAAIMRAVPVDAVLLDYSVEALTADPASSRARVIAVEPVAANCGTGVENIDSGAEVVGAGAGVPDPVSNGKPLDHRGGRLSAVDQEDTIGGLESVRRGIAAPIDDGRGRAVATAKHKVCGRGGFREAEIVLRVDAWPHLNGVAVCGGVKRRLNGREVAAAVDVNDYCRRGDLCDQREESTYREENSPVAHLVSSSQKRALDPHFSDLKAHQTQQNAIVRH